MKVKLNKNTGTKDTGNFLPNNYSFNAIFFVYMQYFKYMYSVSAYKGILSYPYPQTSFQPHQDVYPLMVKYPEMIRI